MYVCIYPIHPSLYSYLDPLTAEWCSGRHIPHINKILLASLALLDTDTSSLLLQRCIAVMWCDVTWRDSLGSFKFDLISPPSLACYVEATSTLVKKSKIAIGPWTPDFQSIYHTFNTRMLLETFSMLTCYLWKHYILTASIHFWDMRIDIGNMTDLRALPVACSFRVIFKLQSCHF